LWIRAATPGSAEIDLMESLDRFVIQVALTANNALDWLRLEDCAVVFAEFPVPGWEPADLLEAILEIAPRTPVILRDPEGTVADAVRLMKLGAYHFMSGPLEENELLGRLEMAAEKHGLRESAAGGGTYARTASNSADMSGRRSV